MFKRIEKKNIKLIVFRAYLFLFITYYCRWARQDLGTNVIKILCLFVKWSGSRVAIQTSRGLFVRWCFHPAAVFEHIALSSAYTKSLQSNALSPISEGDQTTETTTYLLYQSDIYGSCALVRIKLLKWLTLREKGENLFLSRSANRSNIAGLASNLQLLFSQCPVISIKWCT